MEKNNNFDKIDQLSAKVDDVYNKFYNTKGKEINIEIISSYFASFDELMLLIENENLSSEQISKLQLSKNFNFSIVNDFADFKEYFLLQKDAITSSIETPDGLIFINDNNKELFHRIIKENSYMCDSDNYNVYYTKERYNKLLKDPVFCDIAKQINIIKSFENGEIKLVDIDDSILQNDYNMNRICQAITEKLYTAFKDKLENANTPEQEKKIKEMLDKKIESTVVELQARREKSLQQDHNNVEEEIKKYEI